MSLSFPTVAAKDFTPDTATASKEPAKLTTSQQLHKLASSGQSAQQIATALGLPQSQVNQALGVKPTAAAPTPEAVVIPGRLSVKA